MEKKQDNPDFQITEITDLGEDIQNIPEIKDSNQLPKREDKKRRRAH